MMPALDRRMKNAGKISWDESRLKRHSDYQRVYANSRKQFSASMTYFFAVRLESTRPGAVDEVAGDEMPARVGLTAGRVMGKAVERNRIKRRMREAVRRHLSGLPPGVDVVLHPRKAVMTMDFAALEQEVGAVFSRIADAVEKRIKRSGSSGPANRSGSIGKAGSDESRREIS